MPKMLKQLRFNLQVFQAAHFRPSFQPVTTSAKKPRSRQPERDQPHGHVHVHGLG